MLFRLTATLEQYYFAVNVYKYFNDTLQVI